VAPADGDEVDAKVLDVMSTVGVDTYQVDINVYADFTEVVAVFSPIELRSDVSWRIGIANTGQITAGSGPLRSPVIAGEVTTVDLDEAMLRLGRIAQSTPVQGQVPPASTIAVTVGPDGTNAAPAVAPGTVAPATVAPVPFTLPTITSIEPALASVWDISNVKWLVPALTVRGDAGFVATVPIISADFVRIVDAASVDVPVRTGPPLTPPVPLPTVAPPTTTSNLTVPVDTSNEGLDSPEMGLSFHRGVNWRLSDATVDGPSITLGFTGTRAYDPGDPCTETYTAQVIETEAEVRIGVLAWRPPLSADDPIGCSAEGYERDITVELKSPMNGRQLAPIPASEVIP
jgi:hypothetical protein